MHYVYVLHCGDGKLYIGVTSNLRKRIVRHQQQQVFATKGRQPVQLIFFEGFLREDDALRREHYFKTSPGKRALKLMLRAYIERGKKLHD